MGRRFGRATGRREARGARLSGCATVIRASALVVSLAAGGGAFAADLGYAPYSPPPAPSRADAAAAAYQLDPRCVVAPMPQADLVGDTARFRATAVCQSRGLYADTVIFSGPPVAYGGYAYGYAR